MRVEEYECLGILIVLLGPRSPNLGHSVCVCVCAHCIIIGTGFDLCNLSSSSSRVGQVCVCN